MKKKYGFVEIEVILAWVAAFLILLMLAGSFTGCVRNFTGANKTHAINEFTSWVNSQYPAPCYQIQGMVCNDWDSGGDGYVSCSATIDDTKNDETERLSVECAGWLNGGCREQRIGVRR